MVAKGGLFANDAWPRLSGESSARVSQERQVRVFGFSQVPQVSKDCGSAGKPPSPVRPSQVCDVRQVQAR